MPQSTKTTRANPQPDDDALTTLIALVEGIDHAQNASLQATDMLREEIGALQGLLAHLIQILTPEQPESEGPSLRDLLALVIQQQREMTRLLKETLQAAGRIDTRLAGSKAPSSPSSAS